MATLQILKCTYPDHLRSWSLPPWQYSSSFFNCCLHNIFSCLLCSSLYKSFCKFGLRRQPFTCAQCREGWIMLCHSAICSPVWIPYHALLYFSGSGQYVVILEILPPGFLSSTLSDSLVMPTFSFSLDPFICPDSGFYQNLILGASHTCCLRKEISSHGSAIPSQVACAGLIPLYMSSRLLPPTA